MFNPLTLAVLERTTSYSVSFAQWTSTGVFLAAAHVPICYLVLKWMLPPEVQALPDRRSHIRRQRDQLGPLSRGEKNVVLALTVMLVLWMLPTFVTIEFLDVWYAPPAAMGPYVPLPGDTKRGEMTLDRKDFQEGVPWNVLFLVVGGMALVNGLTRQGVTDWIGASLAGNVAPMALPWVVPIIERASMESSATAHILAPHKWGGWLAGWLSAWTHRPGRRAAVPGTPPAPNSSRGRRDATTTPVATSIVVQRVDQAPPSASATVSCTDLAERPRTWMRAATSTLRAATRTKTGRLIGGWRKAERIEHRRASVSTRMSATSSTGT